MSIKWAPASEEELARRGIGVTKERVRAREADGTFQADDPATPEVNEAWVKKIVRKRATPAKKKDG